MTVKFVIHVPNPNYGMFHDCSDLLRVPKTMGRDWARIPKYRCHCDFIMLCFGLNTAISNFVHFHGIQTPIRNQFQALRSVEMKERSMMPNSLSHLAGNHPSGAVLSAWHVMRIRNIRFPLPSIDYI